MASSWFFVWIFLCLFNAADYTCTSSDDLLLVVPNNYEIDVNDADNIINTTGYLYSSHNDVNLLIEFNTARIHTEPNCFKEEDCRMKYFVNDRQIPYGKNLLTFSRGLFKINFQTNCDYKACPSKLISIINISEEE